MLWITRKKSHVRQARSVSGQRRKSRRTSTHVTSGAAETSSTTITVKLAAAGTSPHEHPAGTICFASTQSITTGLRRKASTRASMTCAGCRRGRGHTRVSACTGASAQSSKKRNKIWYSKKISLSLYQQIRTRDYGHKRLAERAT